MALLVLMVALWFAFPARAKSSSGTCHARQCPGCIQRMFASLSIHQPGQVIGYTADDIAGRYLLPVLLAWFATMMTMFFAELPSSTSISSSKGAKPSLTFQHTGPCAGGKTSKKLGWQATAPELIIPVKRTKR